MIRWYASQGGIDPDSLVKAAADIEVNETKAKAEKAESDKRKAFNVDNEKVAAEIAGMTFDSDSVAVFAAIAYVTERNKKVWINADGTLGTDLKANAKGNKGGKGRPKTDAPTGLIDVETNEEILGGVSTFIKANEGNWDDDVLAALYTDKDNLRPRSKQIEALLKFELVTKA